MPYEPNAKPPVNLRWAPHDPIEIAAMVRRLAETTGGCISIMLNTVRRVQEVAEAFRNDPFWQTDFVNDPNSILIPGSIIVLHSRFTQRTRASREQVITRSMGKAAVERRERPYLVVVISSQIAEQSLDIDFDFMITDLAPIDLLLQRMGREFRFWMTDRPIGCDVPTLWIIRPDGMEDTSLPASFDEYETIYDRWTLLRSQLVVNDRITDGTPIVAPDDISTLTDLVYDEDISEREFLSGMAHVSHRPHWEHELDEARKKWVNVRTKHGLMAEMSMVDFVEDPRQLLEAFSAIEDDQKACTRIVGRSVIIVLLHRINGKLYTHSGGEKPVNIDDIDDPMTRSMIVRSSFRIVEKSGYRDVVDFLMGPEKGIGIDDKVPLLPESWKSDYVLRNYRLVELTDGSFDMASKGGPPVTVTWDPFIGFASYDRRKGRRI